MPPGRWLRLQSGGERALVPDAALMLAAAIMGGAFFLNSPYLLGLRWRRRFDAGMRLAPNSRKA